jgi:diguanylate cyclase (GGDEF)-like protein
MISVKNTYRVFKEILMSNTGNILLRQSAKQKLLTEKFACHISRGKIIGVMYLDIVRFHEVQQIHGSIMVDRVLNLLEESLKKIITKFLPDDSVLAVENLWADDFVILFTLSDKTSTEELSNLAVALRLSLRDNLSFQFIKLLGSELELHIGYAIIEPAADIKHDIKLYNALREAQKVAKGTLSLGTINLAKKFKELLSNHELRSVYQPIVSLSSGEILGWEALTRGPENSYFSNPDVIFSFAEEIELLCTTEMVCRETAINNFGKLGPEQKLFLNVNPRTMTDPNFVKGETLKKLEEYGLTPQNIVFEITEQHSIKNYYLFKKTVEHYRNQGYQVAADDVGAGFSGLQSIAEIRPDFIKVDMSLIRDIHINPVKEAVVESLITLAEKINSQVIAEGIESQNELNTLLSLGVHFGQGFYLARPAFPKQTVNKTLISYIKRQKNKDLNGNWRQPLSIGDIAVPAVIIHEDTSVAEVKEKLDMLSQPIGGVVVVRKERPIGLVMRHKLYRVLSSQYGVPLYWQRPISVIMDCSPLQVENHITIEQAAEIAMNREQDKIYDDIVVVEKGKLTGVVTIQKMLDSITKIQVELAKGANPLTSLPGNVAIELELSRRAGNGQNCIVIYADLDRFKSYNDTYGFERGDQMIKLTARIVSHATKKYGSRNDFVGHIGGDDLIIITLPEYAEHICRSIVLLFERLKKRCFSPNDREQSEFYGQDRDGLQKWLPLVSVSLAIVKCQDKKSYLTLAERAAQLKKYAKSLPGSVYVQDRFTDYNIQ